MSDGQTYESEWTAKGFNQRFDEIRKHDPEITYPQAYLQTETEHHEKFKKYRYKSFDAFRSSRLHLIKAGKI